ncbi:MAG: hypothetical protein QM753_15175 [Thermomicrobiales bacterium]
MRSRLALLLTLILTFALSGVGIAHAQGDVPRPPQFGPTPTATEGADETDPACVGLADYYRDLNRAFMGADALNDFFDGGANYEELTERTAKPIITDTDTLIETIEGLDVPEVYTDGNAGIAMFMGFIRDQVAFYGLDSTKVPKFSVVDEAYQLIYDGETATAKACPREIEEFGGYIFIDPATIKDDVDTGD